MSCPFYVHVYQCVHIHTHIYIYIYFYLFIYIHIYIYTYNMLHISIYVCVCIIYLYVCIIMRWFMFFSWDHSFRSYCIHNQVLTYADFLSLSSGTKSALAAPV